MVAEYLLLLQPSYIKFLRFFELCLAEESNPLETTPTATTAAASSSSSPANYCERARDPGDNPVYLSDKRPINLFGLSPTPFPRPEALRRQAPICWFTGDMAAADSERTSSYFSRRIPVRSKTEKGGISQAMKLTRRGTLVPTLSRISGLCRGFSYEFPPTPPSCRGLDAPFDSNIADSITPISILYSEIAIPRGKLVPRALLYFVASLTRDRLKVSLSFVDTKATIPPELRVFRFTFRHTV